MSEANPAESHTLCTGEEFPAERDESAVHKCSEILSAVSGAITFSDWCGMGGHCCGCQPKGKFTFKLFGNVCLMYIKGTADSGLKYQKRTHLHNAMFD